MAKRYIRINNGLGWANKPSTATQISAGNLNHMDKGIDDLDNAIEDLYNVKIDKSSTANNLVTTEAGLVLDARQGKVLKDGVDELNKNFQGTLPASSKGSRLDSAGWYRVAEYQTYDLGALIGSYCNSVNISIKRAYQNTNNEYYNMLLMSIYNKSRFVLIGKLVNTQCIDQIRHTIDVSNLKAYIEIHYSLNAANGIKINLYDTGDVGTLKWVTIAPTATEETVDGVSVVSSMDLTV